MKKLLFLIIIFIFRCLISSAQDVIIMKNGDEVKAKVTEVGTNEIKYKKFDNPDGPLYSVLKNEVFMVKYQNGAKDIFTSQSQKTDVVSTRDKKSEFIVIPEVNFAFGISDNNDDKSYGFQMVFGFKPSPISTVGFGIGYDKYDNVEMLPLFADFRFFFTGSNTTPFLGVALGHSVGLTDGSKGGLMVNPTLGFRANLGTHTAFFMSVGYRLQENSYEYYFFYGTINGKQSLGFLNLKAGFDF